VEGGWEVEGCPTSQRAESEGGRGRGRVEWLGGPSLGGLGANGRGGTDARPVRPGLEGALSRCDVLEG
jgi:hypothetical protein